MPFVDAFISYTYVDTVLFTLHGNIRTISVIRYRILNVSSIFIVFTCIVAVGAIQYRRVGFLILV